MMMVERRSRVHVEVCANVETAGHTEARMEVPTEKLKAPCDTFTASFTSIGRCHNLDTQGRRAKNILAQSSLSKVEEKTAGARIMS